MVLFLKKKLKIHTDFSIICFFMHSKKWWKKLLSDSWIFCETAMHGDTSSFFIISFDWFANNLLRKSNNLIFIRKSLGWSMHLIQWWLPSYLFSWHSCLSWKWHFFCKKQKTLHSSNVADRSVISWGISMGM